MDNPSPNPDNSGDCGELVLALAVALNTSTEPWLDGDDESVWTVRVILDALQALPVEQRMEAMGMENVGWWSRRFARFNRPWELGEAAGAAPVFVESTDA